MPTFRPPAGLTHRPLKGAPLRWRQVLGWHPDSPAARVAPRLMTMAGEAYQDNAKNYSRNLLVSRATLETVIESTRWNVETKRNVAVDDVFDFSIVREILKEMGETAK